MRALGNILWHFPFFGFINAAICFLLGSLLVITVIAAPIGLGLVQYSKFLLLPYSYAMIVKPKGDVPPSPLWKTYSAILKIVYVIFIGIPLFLLTCVQIVGLCCTIIGIPAAIILAKSVRTYLQPVDKICVPYRVADVIEDNKAVKEAQKFVR